MKYLIQRYLASHFILPFCITTLFFIVFLLIFQMFRLTKWIINKGVEVSTVLELIGHIAISFLPLAIPLASLFATILCLGRLSEDSEIIVMRSMGLSKFNLFKPFLIFGMLISLVIFSLSFSIIPHSNKEFKVGVAKLTSKGILADIKPGQFFTEIPGVTLFASKIYEKGKKLINVFIYMKDENSITEKIITAKTGEIIKKKAGKWGGAELNLNLSKGNIITVKSGTDKVEKILFDEYTFPVHRTSFGLQPNDRLEMKTMYEIFHLMKDKTYMSSISKKYQVKTMMEFWSRFNTFLTTFAFILLGFGLGIRKSRGKSRSTGMICALVLFLYYILHFAGLTLAKNEILHPFLAVFVPTMLCYCVGYWNYKKLDWIS